MTRPFGEVLATRMDRAEGAGQKHEADVDGAELTFWIETT